MSTFFDISIENINLFSIMIGISLVSLSSLYSGRIRWTRIAFFYLAGVALYFGYIKDPISATTTHLKVSNSSDEFSRVDTASTYSGKIRKQ